MIKNIVFDIGDVILNFDFMRTLNEITDNLEKREFILKNILNTPDWMGFTLIDNGYLTIEEAITIVQNRTKHKEDELVEKFFKNYFLNSHFNKKVLDLIKKLRKKYKIFLLSNINKYTFEFIKNSELFKIVDGFILSFEVHQVKPKKAIYKSLIEKYNIKFNESLFIDDNFFNVKTAKKLGFLGICVLPNDYNDLIKKLDEIMQKS